MEVMFGADFNTIKFIPANSAVVNLIACWRDTLQSVVGITLPLASPMCYTVLAVGFVNMAAYG